MSARILIVDDEEVVVRSCLRILADQAYEIDTVTDGNGALAKVAAQAYDVIVLDLMMPKMDGLEVLRRVKASDPATAIIMMTGLAQNETALQAMELGAFAYIPKPFDPDELSQAVRRALEKR